MVDTTAVIIDDDLVLDVNNSIIGTKDNNQKQHLPFDDLVEKIDTLEVAINNLESSLDHRTTSNLSQLGREGIYEKAGLITNIVIGVIIALVFILLLL